jgi:hypothetical protein
VSQVEEIEPPDWVPAMVIAVANYLLDQSETAPPQITALIERLVTDERMQGVWRELGRHRRDNHISTADLFRNPTLPDAILSWETTARELRNRAVALRQLGADHDAGQIQTSAAAIESRLDPAIPIGSELPPEGIELAHLFAQIVSVYVNARDMVSDKELEAHVARLRSSGQEDIASAFERQSKEPSNARFLVQRRRTDGRQNAFIEGMGIIMRDMYEISMPGVIATLANVVFETDSFHRERVRAILETEKKSLP